MSIQIVFLVIFLCGRMMFPNPAMGAAHKIAIRFETVRVHRVIDGDTIVINQNIRVRYIGIDTPETHHPRRPVECLGKEATEANKELVEGKFVILERDSRDLDRYGRWLRYVFLKFERPAFNIRE
jgi:micrococcal nuclease